ncbi:hypothetical protein JQ617_34625 [Bradyrhizobium sp. KB893862 SZCCT0404]|uniref:hypothetical protein n=1 Tax=Bradyrhizobium sp. KB893862 SZCCT0404 TaxID=2807672 RepID=UPI001BA6CBD8|nr:hypothetical protein [Bradyrhizobium sp. KB893862 SZCCT0404]MBR1179143.1 hypothetical protein [Bradyrhizobium sp. KB893862 SZCCT0404]
MVRNYAFVLLAVLLLLLFTSGGPPEIRIPASGGAPTTSYGRMTEDAYAKENDLSVDAVGKRFAASGVLRCPGGASSAQVTGARDVITTVAHAFRDACKPHTSPDKCIFEYYLGAERRTIPLSADVWMGSCVDRAPRQGRVDWAVARLAFPADVTPYEIYEQAETLVDMERVLAVVGYDIEAAGKTDKDGPFNKTIQECQIRNVRDWQTFETNCEFEFGASGSALFRVWGRRMTMLGVVFGDYHDKDYCPHGSCEFRSRKWSSLFVTLRGEFKDRLLAAVRQSAPR